MTKHDTVKAEKERVITNHRKSAKVRGIRIIGLRKTYNKYPFGIKSKHDVEALNDIFIQADDGELLTILGHNGAGKSTLINVLTGLLSGTGGRAFIGELELGNDRQKIQELMGVCPQFDTLWEELTAYQHLKMFCYMKGVHESMIQWEIDKRLREVSLIQFKHMRISTYSGGMRRRISLAISAIGNPKIIFMDEPTTGMDPQTRRHVWEMIRQMKKNRLVILTTHAMEEADVLSDRIAVMVDGTIKSIGTPLYLKNNFSDGYRLSIVVSNLNIGSVRMSIKSLLPSSNVMDEKGGSLIISVPVDAIQELKQFFNLMENNTLLSEN